MAELDEIVAKMESGELPLDDMLSAYKRGAELVRFCRGKLDNAQAEIKKLDESGDDGGGGLMDFDGSKDG